MRSRARERERDFNEFRRERVGGGRERDRQTGSYHYNFIHPCHI